MGYEQQSKKFKPFFLTVLVSLGGLILLSGCISLLKGEYYLSSKKYDQGIHAFEQAVRKKPDLAENHFYLGRFFLAQKNYSNANLQLKKTVFLAPDKATYHFWLGVSYGGLNETALEMKSYLKTIELSPSHYKAYTYLGHNLFRSKKYTKALKNYEKALLIRPENPSALYNSGLILRRLKRVPEANAAFKQYIETYGHSPKSIAAATYLNQMGDFEYRVHLINKRKMVLKEIRFDRMHPDLKKESLPWIKKIGEVVKRNPRLVLHILAYQKNNKGLAREKAKAIKRYLQNYFLTIQPEQIKLSWFGIPEHINAGNRSYTLDESINLFAILK